MTLERTIGQTASVGFQIGVRRTIPLHREEIWELLISPEGRKLWLGEIAEVAFEKGHKFETQEETTGGFRVVKPPEQIRLTWQPAAWPEASTLQIRLLPASQPFRTTISFHQEKLVNVQQREEMKKYWEEVINSIQSLGKSGIWR
ncbi:SRPBCC domain-containing protein [Paenibacillus sp. N3.4]|uniref:SRPBCC domain-containing protein n=1 Tax=Paenibacillus sp. N3.4 TaxID=2603222 RepID=UPI0011CB2E38|nr:SRPBCC domain-containing protein [Paenibacillus sp. N3.4]TXK75940.1 SRPBCC domain-containing protein [Paenibacillus sp. N3.4]